MAPITITVHDVGGVKLSSEDGYDKWLKRKGVTSLIDSEGDEVDFGSLVNGCTYTLGPTVQQQAATIHRNWSTSVFVLFENAEEGPDPIGTAFAVSDSLLMTAAHNVVAREAVEREEDIEEMADTEDEKQHQEDKVVANLMIAPNLRKSSKGTVAVSNGRPVSLENYHYHHDWAFLKVCNGKLDHFIPLATTPQELPQFGTLEKMCIYHCPVRVFQETRRATTLHAIAKEVNVGIVEDKFLSFQNGGFRGSCGGPYIFRNKVVALHVESVNEAVDFEMLEEEIQQESRKRKMSKIEKVLEVAESTVSAHASLGTGLILQARTGLMKVYNGT